MFERTPAAAPSPAAASGIGPYSAACHALRVALARVTIRSLKPKLTTDTTAAVSSSGAST